MKKIPPIIWGVLLITIIFAAIVISVSLLSPQTKTAAPAANRSVEKTEAASPANPAETPVSSAAEPETTATPGWIGRQSVLFFPALPVNIYQYSLIQIKNTDTENAEDIQVTLLNREGESKTYSISNLEPNSINRFSLKNLAEIPINFSPGLVIVSSNHSLAALAEIFPANSEEKNPDQTLAPISQLTRDLSFIVYPTAENEPAQNRLIITNPVDKLIEAQVTVTTPAEGSQIIFTAELPPQTSQILELPMAKFASFEDKATVNVSSTSSMIGAIYRLDKTGGLLSNILQK